MSILFKGTMTIKGNQSAIKRFVLGLTQVDFFGKILKEPLKPNNGGYVACDYCLIDKSNLLITDMRVLLKEEAANLVNKTLNVEISEDEEINVQILRKVSCMYGISIEIYMVNELSGTVREILISYGKEKEERK